MANLRKHKKVVIFLILLSLVVILPVGYYISSYYSVNDISVQIISATRTLGSTINYTIEIRISAPGAILPLKLYPPTLTLTVDSYDLGGKSFGGHPSLPSADGYDHLVTGGSLAYTTSWLSSFILDPSSNSTLRQSNSNHLLLYVWFPQAFAGWYSPWNGLLMTTSSTWIWNTTQ